MCSNNFLARVRQSQPTDLKINTSNEDARRLIGKRDIVKMGSGVDRIDTEKVTGFKLQDNIFSEEEFKPDHIFKFPLPKPIYTKSNGDYL